MTLSKSRLLAHLQCPKRLWLEVNSPSLKEDSAATEAAYAAGNRLGEVARELFDLNGLGHTFDLKVDGVASVVAQTQDAIKSTSKTLSRRASLFEAAFEAGGARVLVDVLLPMLGSGKVPRWGIVEVKSAASVKDVYLDDAAIQYYAATMANLALDSIFIAHIDKTWIYDGDGCYDGLLNTVDVTQEIQERVRCMPIFIERAEATLKRRAAPAIRTGAQCSDPYPCGFFEHCQSSEPVVTYPVQWIPRAQTNALREHLAKPKIKDMCDVPDELLNVLQLRVKKAKLSGRKWLDARGAADVLAAHTVPCYFLDFETIGDAVPRWAGTRPFQAIPFQFSLHAIGARDGLKHEAFLDLSGNDPRLKLAQALVKVCGTAGAVFAYNAKFEASCLENMAEDFANRPKLAKALRAIKTRLVDLLPIVRNHFYHPAQQGSWSLKAVLPALLPELSYESLDGVKNGMDAQLAYAEAANPKTPIVRVNALRRELLAYCKLDTFALVEIWRKLRQRF
jgi:Domain of unknown function(DUF2779)